MLFERNKLPKIVRVYVRIVVNSWDQATITLPNILLHPCSSGCPLLAFQTAHLYWCSTCDVRNREPLMERSRWLWTGNVLIPFRTPSQDYQQHWGESRGAGGSGNTESSSSHAWETHTERGHKMSSANTHIHAWRQAIKCAGKMNIQFKTGGHFSRH